MQLTPKITVTRETNPSEEPVTLAEAKLFLRVDHTSEDAAISQMIRSAREVAEQILNRSLITQRWLCSIYGTPAHCVSLLYGPVGSIISVTFHDDAGNISTADADSYSLRDPFTLEFANYPSAKQTDILYEAGMAANANGLDAALKQNILQHVAYLYGFRSLDEAVRMHDITRLYAPFREVQL